MDILHPYQERSFLEILRFKYWGKNIPPSAAKIRRRGENPSTVEITQLNRLTINFLPEFDLGLSAQRRPSYGLKRRVLKIQRIFVMLFLYFNLRHP